MRSSGPEARVARFLAAVMFHEQGVEVMGVPDEVSKLVRDSGSNFHAKVARWLSDNGWHVVVSPCYMDQTQNKAREIDLMTEKLWPVNNAFGRRLDDVAVRLFIECKFVPSHSVFWFADKDRVSAQELVCASGPYRADNIYTNKHHYLAQSSKVAKLFATSANKAFDQIYFVDFYAESQPELIKDNFQLEVRYAYFDRHNNQRDDYFLLDFVEYSQLEKFAEAIDEDAKAAAILASPS